MPKTRHRYLLLLFALAGLTPAHAQALKTDWAQLLANKQYQRVIDKTERLMQKSPGNMDARYFHSVALHLSGQGTKAQNDLLQLQSAYRQATDPVGRYRYAMTYYYQGDNHHAIALLKSLESVPGAPPQTALHLAYAYAKTGQYDKAIQLFEGLVKNKEDYSVYYNCALAHYNAGDLEQALADMKSSIRVNPKFHLPYFDLVSIYVLQNKPKTALKWLEKLLKQGEKDLSPLTHDPDLKNFVNSSPYHQLMLKYKV